jgi:hypothetical protein
MQQKSFFFPRNRYFLISFVSIACATQKKKGKTKKGTEWQMPTDASMMGRLLCRDYP